MHTSEKGVLVPFQSSTANSIEAVLSPHSIEIVDFGMDRSIFGSDFSQSTYISYVVYLFSYYDFQLKWYKGGGSCGANMIHTCLRAASHILFHTNRGILSTLPQTNKIHNTHSNTLLNNCHDVNSTT